MSVSIFVKIIWYDRAVWCFIDDNDSSFYHDPIPKIATSFCFQIITAVTHSIHTLTLSHYCLREDTCFLLFFFFFNLATFILVSFLKDKTTLKM